MKIAYRMVILVVLTLLITGTAMGEVSRKGLVAEWHFEKNAEDSSGNRIDGTTHGVTFDDGKFGQALEINSVDDYVDFEKDENRLNFGKSDFSIDFWMKYQGVTTHPYATTIMGKTSGTANTPGFTVWTTSWGSDGSNYGLFIATTTASWGEGNIEDWGKYDLDTWYHVVFVRSGNSWSIYRNGVLSNSGTKNGIGLDVTNDVSFKIGNFNESAPASAPHFKGMIDEVRIYNRALTEEEVKDNYESSLIAVTSNPSDAEIFVDGVSKGNASPNLLIYGLSPGTHTVKCHLSGYEDNETTVDLAENSIESVSFSLKEVPKEEDTFNVELTPDASNLKIQESSQITVSVTDSNGNKVQDAKVILESKDGNFNRSIGTTDSSGIFTSSYKPFVLGNALITATVKKEGFVEGNETLQLAISPKPPIPWWVWITPIFLFITILVGSIVYIRRKKGVKNEKVEKKVEAKIAEEKKNDTKLCLYCKTPLSLDADLCHKCGKKQEEKKRFCMNCGALMPNTSDPCSRCGKTPPSDVDTKECKNCDEVIPSVAKFCSACGAVQPK